MKRNGTSRKVRAATSVVLSAAIAALTVAGSLVIAQRPASAATACATPGKDGSGGALGTVVNSYFIPASGTAIAGSTTLTLSSATPDSSGGGATTAITAGDLLLVIQMQDGSYTSTNGTSYGDGVSGTGYTSLSSAGLYEYVAVTAIAGSSVTITGTGAGNGLINSYHETAAGLSNGQQTFQIVRVPQYVTAQLTNTFTGAYWDGATGGVAALDIASTLNLGGANLYVTGDGFSGGGLTVATSAATGWSSGDYAQLSTAFGGANTVPGFGSKGEGIMGRPNYTFTYTNFTTPSAPSAPTVASTGTNGYPGGDQGRGAPGNGGGGGTDDDPPSNDQNTGGGGGGNGGSGGNGGYPWTPKYSGSTPLYVQYPYVSGTKTYTAGNFADIGGRGGAALTPSVPRIFLGGGGGAGSNNNNSNSNAFGKYGSSGGTGGGILMMRIASASGTPATINANGTTGLAPLNDGGGGGGAGGSVLVTSPATFSGITVNANGAAGTTANASAVGLANQHGPGGGGGGGVVLSSSPVTASVSAGLSGTTTTSVTTYGATAGTAGVVNSSVSYTAIPGVGSGAECSSGTGTNTIYTGPYNGADAVYYGAALTGSFDGSVPVTNDNDFVAALIPLVGVTPVNTGTIPGTPIGSTVTFSTLPTIDIPHVLYYNNTQNTKHTLTVTAQAPTAPAGWTVQICPDSGAPNGTGGVLASPTTANCAGTGFGGCTNAGNFWMTVGANVPAANNVTAQYCIARAVAVREVVYWTRYTPSNSVTAFARYDGSIAINDDNVPPSFNSVHDELYAGAIALTKSVAVVSSGCPAGATPTYSALGVCPGGILRYTIDYRNIIAGGGLGTEASVPVAFTLSATKAGSLVLVDDGTLSGVSQTTTPNWSTFTNGLTAALQAGVVNTSCGVGANPCGDTIVNSVVTYDAGHPSGVGATKFSDTIGGAAFQLFPIGVSGMTGQGTITFAVTVK